MGNGDVKNLQTIKKDDINGAAAAATVVVSDANGAATKEKLPPRPADYDYYWYQDEDGNWRNEYDDYGYEFDPDRYEGEENSKPEDSSAAVNKSSDEASTGTVIPSATGGPNSARDDLDKQLSLEVDKHLLTPSP